MVKKTEKTSIALFDDNKLKNKNNNGTNNSKCKSTSKRAINNSTNKANKANNSKQQKVRKLDGDNAKINAKSKSKRSEAGKESKKSRTKSKEQHITDISANENNEIKKVKVGRKDRKHNWWNGCDYVWVDGIDHWVSKTAFRNDGNDKPVYALSNYVQGLDSYWVLRYKPKNPYITESEKALNNANNELKKKCKTWKEISEIPKLSEAFITKYKDHISWITIFTIAEENNRVFSDNFKKKHIDKFKMWYLIK